MPIYNYTAKSGPGKTVKGEVRAESRDAALAAVDAMGLTPVSINEKTEQAERWGGFSRLPSRADVTLFTRQLAGLIHAGVPILQALRTVRDQSEQARLGKFLERIEHVVRDGQPLSTALSEFPEIFDELYVNMVCAGESGGVLDDVLSRLADAREHEAEVRRKVQAALAYPVLVVLVGFATLFVMFSFFLPRMLDLFRDYTSLPWPTVVLMRITEWFDAYWVWLVLVFVLIWAVLRRMATHENGRLVLHHILLVSPWFGRFVRQADLSRFARTCALLLDSGIAIDKALDLAAMTMRNSVLRMELAAVRHSVVQDGSRVSDGLARCAHVPVFMARMAAVGEQGGRLDSALTDVAQFYEQDLEQRSRVLTSLLEPLLILVVGGFVGFVVAAMLLPVFQLSLSR